MKARILTVILLCLTILSSCEDEGSQKSSSGGDVSENVMPSLSNLGIRKRVKSYKFDDMDYSFQQGNDKNGNVTFKDISLKCIYYDSFGSMKLKWNPFEIQLTFRENLNIMNDYYQNFKFRYEGGPVVEMDNIFSDGTKNGKVKVVLDYDDNDYLLSVVETFVYDDNNKTQILKHVLEWETSENTSGKRLKAIYKYSDDKLYDQLIFNYYSRSRVNKDGITPNLLSYFIECMDFYVINTCMAQYGFWGRPSSELPSSFHWGLGADGEKLNTIFYTENSTGSIIKIKNGNYIYRTEEFTYY